MRNAPSVTYPVGRSSFYARLMWGAGVSGLLGVLMSFVYGSWRTAVFCGVVWCLWLLGSMWAWRRMPRGKLAWQSDRMRPEAPQGSSGVWSWASEAYREGVELKRVERVYDLQRAMLLRLHNPDGARTWIWVERLAEPSRWLDLRRALLAHA
ncbi:hypothetical protein [Hydrogenophaga pseudoflava]|jgi:hypothetical protein|uniref:hypothetical protein n=1 Tax=Hydrogenophaga pseudoflava TaxID=47421 RepID=UPI0008259536|nr:hypothetical protein [Hydrogenophaga pseudoflava]